MESSYRVPNEQHLRNKSFITRYAVFTGRGGKKGEYRVDIQLKEGINLNKGKGSELIHNGTLRDKRHGEFDIKENDFD